MRPPMSRQTNEATHLMIVEDSENYPITFTRIEDDMLEMLFVSTEE